MTLDSEGEPLGLQLVAWTSPDEFCVWWFNDYICQPVINYSTYSREDGTGQQNFYMNETFIGDTLELIGWFRPEEVSEDIQTTIRVIIE